MCMCEGYDSYSMEYHRPEVKLLSYKDRLKLLFDLGVEEKRLSRNFSSSDTNLSSWMIGNARYVEVKEYLKIVREEMGKDNQVDPYMAHGEAISKAREDAEYLVCRLRKGDKVLVHTGEGWFPGTADGLLFDYEAMFLPAVPRLKVNMDEKAFIKTKDGEFLSSRLQVVLKDVVLQP